VVSDPKYRMWVYRIVAPAAFFLAATILVILIERGLDGSSADTTSSAVPTATTPVTTPTSPSTTTSKKKQIYRVKVGDTLESIAAKFDTTVDDLLAMNPGIDPLALSPGQKIRVA
jgi:LysM repeat protein